jgi:hypothetical protein
VSARWAPRPAGLLVLALLVCPSTPASAQAVSVTTAADALTIRAPGFTFLKGPALARLKDGRSLRVELALMVLPEKDRPPVTSARRVFALSYDLWEERFAVTTVDSRSESISHLTAAAAVSWCIERMPVHVSTLGALGANVPFFIRLEYRILDGDDASDAGGESGFTLQGLIDVLSRRRGSESLSGALEAGPFRLPQREGAPPSPR